MSEFSPEEIQRAADEVRHRGFGDFMFRDPGHNQGTSSTSHRTTRKNTTRRTTSSERHTTEPIRVLETKCFPVSGSGCHKSSRGSNQMKSSWKDGNMWELRIRG
jgi:hypothetical protein